MKNSYRVVLLYQPGLMDFGNMLVWKWHLTAIAKSEPCDDSVQILIFCLKKLNFNLEESVNSETFLAGGVPSKCVSVFKVKATDVEFS